LAFTSVLHLAHFFPLTYFCVPLVDLIHFHIHSVPWLFFVHPISLKWGLLPSF
jgi:hypothetical protein